MALLVLPQPLDRELQDLTETGVTGTEWSVKEAAEVPAESVHMLVSLPILVLRAAEVASILEILRSTGTQPHLLPIRLALEPPTSCLAVPVELEQLL